MFTLTMFSNLFSVVNSVSVESFISCFSPFSSIQTFISSVFSCVSEEVCPPKIGAITKPTKHVSLIKIFIDGPEVSLKGSPTVSPVTAALCALEPL